MHRHRARLPAGSSEQPYQPQGGFAKGLGSWASIIFGLLAIGLILTSVVGLVIALLTGGAVGLWLLLLGVPIGYLAISGLVKSIEKYGSRAFGWQDGFFIALSVLLIAGGLLLLL